MLDNNCYNNKSSKSYFASLLFGLIFKAFLKQIIALSYSRVPGQGDIYVKGSGNINDLNLNNLFKKPPKKIED